MTTTNDTNNHTNNHTNTNNPEHISKVLYGEETAKALVNFTISEMKMPRAFLWALGEVKSAAAIANMELGLLEPDKAMAIKRAAQSVANGFYDDQFPLDVFQTGSGTSTNMNANEVIASLVALQCEGKISVHPLDEVNLGQSSNDVIPSCIHLSAASLIENDLLPALSHLVDTLDNKAKENQDTIKTGRTHLMDAMPLSFGQEISAWRDQINFIHTQLQHNLQSLCKLAIGGTAVGTGVNTHPEFGTVVTRILSGSSGLVFTPADNYFQAISTQDTAVSISGNLKTAAVSLSKISNDIRWLSSGPLNGLNEIHLPEIQKGSSIMPGKVNPVIPEAVMMGCTQVIGNDTTITLAAQSGNFQLNTMLPLIGHTLIQSIQLLTTCSTSLADKAIKGMQINHAKIAQSVARNPMLVTALTSLIGYDKSAEIAKKAYKENRTVLDVAKELTNINEAVLIERLEPRAIVGDTKM